MRQLLVARDYQEVINYSFVDETWESRSCRQRHPCRLKNPDCQPDGRDALDTVRRIDRICCASISTASRNVCACLKSGAVSLLAENAFCQPEELGRPVLWRSANQSSGAKRCVRWISLMPKADVEAFAVRQIRALRQPVHPALHPGQSAQVWLEVRRSAGSARCTRTGSRNMICRQRRYCSSWIWPHCCAAGFRRFAEISKFPAVRRDIAVVVDEDVNVQTLLDGMSEHLPESCDRISRCLTCIAAKALILVKKVLHSGC